jgi:hypothetical protein
MRKYSASNLAVMSTILTCATRTREWSNLGTQGNPTQEEVQMMRVGDQLFIACNGNGHTLIVDFLKRFGVSDEATLIASLKWVHFIASAIHVDYNRWQHHAARRVQYSAQESNTIAAFGMPPGIPATATVLDKGIIYDCAGKPSLHPAPQTPNDWKTARFLHLLGAFGNIALPVLPPANAANYSTRSHNQAHIVSSITVITDTTAQVHAEMKLLAYLAKMSIDGKVNVGEVQLGGLKNACVSCQGWINRYESWIRYRRNIKLKLPYNDPRPHATPVNWANPRAAQTVKDDSAVKSLLGGDFA